MDSLSFLKEKNELHYSLNNILEMNDMLKIISANFGSFKVYSLIKSSLIEFVLNGFKAYLKRRYFELHSLSFNIDYDIGLKGFKEDLHDGKISINDMNELKLKVDVNIFLEAENVKFQVLNFSTMNQDEISSVVNIFKKAYSGKNLSMQMNSINNSEGAGLGLIMIFSMMKNLGIPTENINFVNKEGVTEFFILIPINQFL